MLALALLAHLAAADLPRVAVVVRDGDASVRERVSAALLAAGRELEPAGDVAALVAEAESADHACAPAELACWAKVGAYGGFRAFAVVVPRGEVASDARHDLYFVDVGNAAVRGPVPLGADGDAAVRALLSPPSSPPSVIPPSPPSPPSSSSPPSPPSPPSPSSSPSSASTLTSASAADEPSMSTSTMLWISSGGALALAVGCGVAATAFDIVAAEHIALLDAGESGSLEPAARAKVALDVEGWQIAALSCAGVAAAASIGAAAMALAGSE